MSTVDSTATDVFQSVNIASRRISEMAAASLRAGGAQSTADVLKALRQAFPDMPLAERVAALAALSRN